MDTHLIAFILVILVFFFITLYTGYLEKKKQHNTTERIILVVCTSLHFYCVIMIAFVIYTVHISRPIWELILNKTLT